MYLDNTKIKKEFTAREVVFPHTRAGLQSAEGFAPTFSKAKLFSALDFQELFLNEYCLKWKNIHPCHIGNC